MTVKTPAAVQKFIDAATAAGMKVEVVSGDDSVAVYVENGTRNASITYGMQNIYDSPMSNERLAFRTRGADRRAMRFDHGTGFDGRNYHVLRSVRAARVIVGLGA